MNINTFDKLNQSKNVMIDKHPDECPICHNNMIPSQHCAFLESDHWQRENCLQIVWKCPRLDCQRLFISNYEPRNSDCNNFHFINSMPVERIKRKFSETIEDISENFCKIYNEAYFAEQDNLLEICGVGYRKSLEFLIKDYLIKLQPDIEKEIKQKFLGKCISEDIKNENISKVAKRAVWLGNDETHYLKKWEGKDLEDLKRLINLTVHWFEMENLTQEVINDMPDEKEKEIEK